MIGNNQKNDFQKDKTIEKQWRVVKMDGQEGKRGSWRKRSGSWWYFLGIKYALNFKLIL